jgi:hypothetical protein
MYAIVANVVVPATNSRDQLEPRALGWRAAIGIAGR